MCVFHFLFLFWHRFEQLGQAEVYADDLATVFVWQRGKHEDVAPEDRAKGLQFSRLKRTIFLESLRLHGVKVSSLVMGVFLIDATVQRTD